MKKIIFSFTIFSAVLFAACDKNPMGALIYPNVSQSTRWAGKWVIYDDVLKTRGSFDFPCYTDYWNTRKSQLDLDYTKDAHNGFKSMYVYWDGSASREQSENPDRSIHYGTPQNIWVGFGFESADPAGGIDIPAGLYNYLNFSVKGVENSAGTIGLAQGVVLTIKDPFDNVVYQSPQGYSFNGWNNFSVPVNLSTGKVKMLISIVLEKLSYGASNGGAILIDDIIYTKLPMYDANGNQIRDADGNDL